MTISADYIRTSLQAVYGESVTAADIRAWCAMNGANYQTVTNKLNDYKTSRGKWNLTIQEAREQFEQVVKAPAAIPAIEQNLIPEKDDTFVKFGNFGDVRKIIESRLFYPTFITGLSGNGKTTHRSVHDKLVQVTNKEQLVLLICNTIEQLQIMM